MTITFHGEERVMRKLRQLARKEGERIGPALRNRAKSVLSASQGRVPVDTGALKASGRVGNVRGKGEDTEVSVRYGPTLTGSSHGRVFYAGIVHELENKYLEAPLLEAAATLLQDLKKDLDVERL